jgi:hypothetical protein
LPAAFLAELAGDGGHLEFCGDKALAEEVKIPVGFRLIFEK